LRKGRGKSTERRERREIFLFLLLSLFSGATNPGFHQNCLFLTPQQQNQWRAMENGERVREKQQQQNDNFQKQKPLSLPHR